MGWGGWARAKGRTDIKDEKENERNEKWKDLRQNAVGGVALLPAI